MELLDYLQKKIEINIDELPNVIVDEKISRTSSIEEKKFYMELDLDNIENVFPVNFSFKSTFLDKYNINIKKEEISNNNFNLFEVMYKDGKYYPYYSSYGIPHIYITVAYIKQLKKEHPEMEMPPFICKVYGYDLGEYEEIYNKYTSFLSNFIIVRNYIFIDKDKNKSIILDTYYKNRDGIRINKKIEKKDIEIIKKEIKQLKKAKEVNNFKNNIYVKIEFNDKGELIFVVDNKEIDVNILYDECLSDCITEYKEKINNLDKIYNNNKDNLNKYSTIMNRIKIINDFFDKYEKSTSSFNGRIKEIYDIKKHKNLNEELYTFFDKYVMSIEEEINNYKSFSIENNLDIMNSKNIELGKYIIFLDNSLNSITANIENMENYLKKEEAEKMKIEKQSVFNILIKPRKNVRRRLSSKYNIISTNSIKETLEQKKDVFMNLQRKQSEALSKDAKYSLMIYKTLLYRPINQIIKIKRNVGDISEIEIDRIINNCYDELKMRMRMGIDFFNLGYKPNIGIFDSNNNLVDYNTFKNIVLSSIPLLENSLSILTLDEPLTVYRGVSTDDINKSEVGFLSTTIDIDVATNFLGKNRTNNGISVLYKINLPVGSPINFFSTEIFTGTLDENSSYGSFGDEQKEVLIDSDNFVFETKSIKTINDANIDRDDRIIYLVEIDAHLKELEYDKKNEEKVK